MSEKNGNKSFTETGLRLKIGLAEMLKGGVIMDVMNVEQARIAEEAGAVSVMALERVPAMIRAEGGVARMAKPSLIKQIIQAVSIPVMAKARIGHFAEAQILQELGVDYIDGDGAGFLGNARLFDAHDVHDDAALEHLGEADFKAQAGTGETLVFWLFRHGFRPRKAADSDEKPQSLSNFKCSSEVNGMLRRSRLAGASARIP